MTESTVTCQDCEKAERCWAASYGKCCQSFEQKIEPIILERAQTDRPCPKCGEKLWERNKHRFPFAIEEYCKSGHYRKEISL